MILKCGTDIIEIKRIQEAIEKGNDSFIKKLFTEKEIEYCESKRNAKYQHYAARFAAKEAVFKAVSDLLVNKYELDWREIEIIHQTSGKPKVLLKKLESKIKQIDISLSHCKQYAIATVVLQIQE